MTRSPATSARLARLSAELVPDLEALDARALELRTLLEANGTPRSSESDDRTRVIVAAVNIHGWYTTLETALERIARLLDETMPSGSTWHADLVSQMSVAVPGLRPAVLDPSHVLELGEVRKFRHFFRNAYVLNFDSVRTTEQAERVVRLHDSERAGLGHLVEHVALVLEGIAEE